LPKPYLEFLGQLAKVLNVTQEAILKDEIYGMLRDFFSSGALEGWVGSLFEDYVNGDKGKQLAAMVEEIDC